MSDLQLPRDSAVIDLCLICQESLSGVMLAVEMNRDADGKFHATQDHLNHAERVSGMAHLACYRKWYEETYRTPFTMSG